LAFQSNASVPSFTSSNLPIVKIYTDGRRISASKIRARMEIIDNEDRNFVADSPNGYNGLVGIKFHGSSSRNFPKQQYAMETWKSDGEDIDVPLLGLPEEEDWILNAPYSDKSLMRNVLAYDLSRGMGRYASRTRYCELLLNDEYEGIYVLLESVKRDKNRVAINKMKSDDVTGGYILRIDRTATWVSPYPGIGTDTHPFYEVREPNERKIAPEQSTYIRSFITGFEAMMASPDYENVSTGYPSVIDIGSFVDQFLLNELSKNVDGLRLSSYLHKDSDSKDSLLHAGPAWDFNLAFANANYHEAQTTSGIQTNLTVPNVEEAVPFWWSKLLDSQTFAEAAQARWWELREDLLHKDSLVQRINETATLLGEASERNFERWPVLGKWVWPNYFVGATFEEEVSYLRDWILGRIDWLDMAFQQTS